MKRCLQTCKEMGVSCPIKECRYWIDFKEDSNCTFDVVEKHGHLTLRECADRLGISYVRVKQLQDEALKKIGLLLKDRAI